MADAKPKPPEPKLSLAAPGIVQALAVDEPRGRVFVGGSEGTIYECDFAAAEPLQRRLHDDSYVSALAVVDNADQLPQLVVGRYDGTLTWFDLPDAQSMLTVAAHDGWIRDLCLLPGGKVLASVADDMLVKLWDAKTGTLLHALAGHERETTQGYVSALYAVAASPDGRCVASADRQGEVRLWDVAGGRELSKLVAKELYTFDGEKRDRSIGGIRRLRFSPDGQRLALAGIGQVTNVDGFVGPARLEVWNVRTLQREAVLQDSHQAVLNDLAWSADGQRLLAAGGGDGGGVIVIWQIDGAQLRYKIKCKGHAQRLAWFEEQDMLLLAGFEGVQLWDVAAWQPLAAPAS